MPRLLYLLLLLLLTQPVAAQVMEGMVIDRESNNFIPGVAILNKHSGAVVFSNTNGGYYIAAEEGDTLIFRHTAYQPVYEVMTFTMGRKFKSVVMQPIIFKLKEATIKGRTKYQQDSLELHQQFEHELNKTLVPKPKSLGLGCVGCIGWLADKITGNSKKPKAFRKSFASEDESKFIDSRYTIELVTTLTGIRDSDSIAVFKYTYPMEYDFARNATDLEIKAFIRNSYKQYMRKKD